MSVRIVIAGFATILTAVLFGSDAFGQTPRRGDQYYRSLAQKHDAAVRQHARELRTYMAGNDEISSDEIKRHTQAIRSGIRSARRAYAQLSNAASQEQQLSQELAQTERLYDQLLKLSDQFDPPLPIFPAINPPTPRFADINAELRYPQAYYFFGNGHFID